MPIATSDCGVAVVWSCTMAWPAIVIESGTPPPGGVLLPGYGSPPPPVLVVPSSALSPGIVSGTVAEQPTSASASNSRVVIGREPLQVAGTVAGRVQLRDFESRSRSSAI